MGESPQISLASINNSEIKEYNFYNVVEEYEIETSSVP